MNKPIRRMAVACMALFLALLLNVTYLQYFRADELNARADNRRAQDAAFSRERGAILIGGRSIAESVPSDGRFEFQRTYSQAQRYAPLTGYFSYTFGRSNVEQTQNDILSGSDPRLFVNRVIDLIGNQAPAGGSVSLTINPRAQAAAWDGIRALGENTKGAVVALEPSTGRILAMVTNPSYDPNRLASHDLSEVNDAWQQLNNNPDRPLSNRAAQEVYQPGSTFKLVTAAAALENGYEPDSRVQGGFELELPQTTNTLPNDGGGNCGGDSITLTQALQVSCNVSFGALGLELGADAIAEQSERFGFGERPFADLSAVATSRFPTGESNTDGPLIAYASIGQQSVQASPLQVAMVAAGIANGGTVMTPYLVDEVTSPDLQVLDKTEPTPLRSEAVSSQTARALTRMMVATVDSGTGTPAQIPGVEVAGKTGTAQRGVGNDASPLAWFVSFAPADDPQVAVAVMIEDAGVARTDIAGGRLAAPIARAVMEAVIR